MRRTLITGPTSEPITLDFVRDWLSFEDDQTADNPVVEELIDWVGPYVEGETNGFKLISQTWEIAFDAAEVRSELFPRLAPVASVSEVKWIDNDGNETVIPSTDYFVRGGRDPMVATLTGWPSVRTYEGLVLTVVVGYADPESIPADITQLLRGLVSFAYSSKGVGILETVSGQLIGIPRELQRQINKLRIVPA
jgi:uncharacterized phiE125 gp8 family phage protein